MNSLPRAWDDQLKRRAHVVRFEQFRRCQRDFSVGLTHHRIKASDVQSLTKTGAPSSSKFMKTVSNNAPATYNPESMSNVNDPYLLSRGIRVVGSSRSMQIPFGREAIETS